MNKNELREQISQGEIPEILLSALRQYQHNDCSGLVFGFDYEETIKIIALIRIATLDKAKEAVNDITPYYFDLVKVESVNEAIDNLKESND